MPDERRSVIYFVQAGGPDAPIKIGVSNDVPARIYGMQTGNHEELRLIGAIYSTRDLEAQLHNSYDGFRIRGEWFAPNPRLLAYIASLPTDLLDTILPQLKRSVCIRCKRSLKLTNNGYCSSCNKMLHKCVS